MEQNDEPIHKDYPHGRGYGHDYMRGGEVFGGYGYSERDEYALPRGDLTNPDGMEETPSDTDSLTDEQETA
jgi:hypothetical protein